MAEEQRRSPIFWLIGLVAVVLLIAIALPFMRSRTSTSTSGSPELPSAGGMNTTSSPVVDMNEILTNPSAYIGQRVAVEGEVKQMFGNQAFILDSIGITNNEILAIIPENVPQVSGASSTPIRVSDDSILQNNQRVRVTGMVSIVTIGEVERFYDPTYAEEIRARFAEKPAIIAETIERI
jgi:hypothetical protein